MNGSVERRSVLITLLDDSRNAVLRWLLREAWIAKFEAPEFDASKNEVAIETIELAHEGSSSSPSDGRHRPATPS